MAVLLAKAVWRNCNTSNVAMPRMTRNPWDLRKGSRYPCLSG